MDPKQTNPVRGNCIISEQVIASIAAAAALETPGVAAMAQSPSEFRDIIKASRGKSVHVVNNEHETVLDVYVMLQIDAAIQQVAADVQQAVKSAVQAMTSKPVTRVNVHVMGIQMAEETQQEEK